MKKFRKINENHAISYWFDETKQNYVIEFMEFYKSIGWKKLRTETVSIEYFNECYWN